MDSTDHKPEIKVFEQSASETVRIEGELSEINSREFESRLRALNAGRGGAITLDLSELDIDDGFAVAVAVRSLRELSSRAGRVVLKGAPQMLCHNLYRVGMLEGRGAIELVDMRLDEPAGF